MPAHIVRRRFPCLLVLLVCAGCYSWRPTAASPRVVIPDEQPREVRVTLADGSVATINTPVIVSDSIVSTLTFGRGAIAAQDVRMLEVRRFSMTKTVGLLVAQSSSVVGLMAFIVHLLPHY